MPKPLSISQLALRFGLSRSTLLYYDRIGLLRARDRPAAGYRCYGAEGERRLQRICELRKTGLAMRAVRVMLAGNSGPARAYTVENLVSGPRVLPVALFLGIGKWVVNIPRSRS